MNRRTFLGTMTAATLLTRRLAFAADDHKIDKIGLQLYTVRDLMKQDFDGTLAKVAAIGYKEVEFAGYFDHSPKDVRAAGIPRQEELTKAVSGRERDRLADLARRFVAAAEYLRVRPDPKGKRDQSAVLRLGLLVNADAARAAQAATYLDPTGQGHLFGVGRSLAAVGADLLKQSRA